MLNNLTLKLIILKKHYVTHNYINTSKADEKEITNKQHICNLTISSEK